MTLDVLVPADGDVPAALEQARTAARTAGLTIVDALPPDPDGLVVAITLASVEDEGWNHHLPGFVAAKIDPDEFELVDRSPGVVRIDARGPTRLGWELLRAAASVAREIADAQDAWIYDPYRAELHDAATFDASIPDPRTRDVRAIVRIMAVVSTTGGLGHLRSIGLWRLGLPELYVPDVPEAYLDAARELLRATAQTMLQDDGVADRGRIAVDLARMPADWPRPRSGTGRFVWEARWMQGPIHDHAMQIVLVAPGARDGDPTALLAGLRAYGLE